MKNTFDVVVVGAGMVGLTVAALLRNIQPQERLRLHVVDAGPRPSFDVRDDIGMRVSAISLGSVEILTAARCWDEISATRACPFRDMRVWDANGSVEGPETLCFDAAEFAVPQLGFIVENALIQNALIGQLESSGLAVNFETAIRDLSSTGNGYRVQLSDGRTVDADLVVGADGGGSFVRRSANVSVQSHNYPHTALVTHLQPERDHKNTAWQRFLRSGPVALLPLGDGRVSTVWSTSAEQAGEAVVASDKELGQLLSDATDGVLGKLAPAGPRGSFPLRSQHADHYVLPGLALVGDAAHCVHPLAGQGVNLGLADAAVLANTVADAIAAEEYPGDLPVLRRYERGRKGANQAMLHFVDGISRLFALESSQASKLRSGGMRLFNASGPLRQRAVEVALGLKL